ncbi:MAG TPA: pentapeptide repeat-containing protein [Ohtaekwangia sp.]|uniref:pentapeptide repeat-containing protein n=1 Tax=Ohtaekwangia sp. TaxID=2066019 RepID=UPI002F92DFFE
MMNKQKLIERWKTVEGGARLKDIIDCLKRGGLLSSVKDLEKYAGRWDLRGAQLSQVEKERKLEAEGHNLVQTFGSFKCKGVKMESIDFSYADISYSWLEKCIITNCIFEETKAKEIHILSSDFSNCVFRKVNLSYSYINENIGSNSGSFKNVEFIETNLSESIFCFPIIEDCLFTNCNLKAANFDGSRLKRCKFKGKVDSPWFRGYSKNAHRSLLGVFNRVNPKDYSNEMEDVDFSEAEMIGVSFSDEIDLTKCIFPTNDEKYILIKKVKQVYLKMKKTITESWDGEDKRKGLYLIDNLYHAPNKQNQDWDFVDTYPLDSNDREEVKFNYKFFTLLKTTNQEF